MRSFINPIKYGHAAGRVKVKETKLLARHQLERLIETRRVEELVRIIDETEYGEFIERVTTTEQVEESLQQYLKELYLFIDEVTNDKNIRAFFRVAHDMQNIKVVLKEQLLEKKIDQAYSELGMIDLRSIERALSEERFQDLPEPFHSACQEAVRRFESNKDAQEIDIVLDKHLYSELYRIATSLKSRLIYDYVKTAIDLNNIKIFLRAKNLGRSKEFLKDSLVENGFVSTKVFSEAFPDVESLITGIKREPYISLIKRTEVEQSGKAPSIDLSLYDVGADNVLLNIIRKAKLISVGPEPLIGYVLARENEVKILKIVLMGAINNISKEKTREKVRDMYG